MASFTMVGLPSLSLHINKASAALNRTGISSCVIPPFSNSSSIGTPSAFSLRSTSCAMSKRLRAGAVALKMTTWGLPVQPRRPRASSRGTGMYRRNSTPIGKILTLPRFHQRRPRNCSLTQMMPEAPSAANCDMSRPSRSRTNPSCGVWFRSLPWKVMTTGTGLTSTDINPVTVP
jgi:hypothetical protein